MRLAALILAFCAALAGCTGGDGNPPLFGQILAAGREAVAIRQRGAAARPALTRAALDTVGKPVLEATLERSGRFAYLFIDAERRDAHPGKITVWRTEDQITLALRAGVLVATRGLGGDLLSSHVAIRADRPGPATGGHRVAVVRTGNQKTLRIDFSCDLADLGPASVKIVEHVHTTRHLRETCTTETGRIVNEYWIDIAQGLVWQSRQWAGPEIGYVTLRRLIK